MNWYYVDGGQQAGPVSDPELAALVQRGKVQADTLVWHEGMSNWQPYREVKPSELRLSTAPPVAVPGGGAIPGGAEAACVRIQLDREPEREVLDRIRNGTGDVLSVSLTPI